MKVLPGIPFLSIVNKNKSHQPLITKGPLSPLKADTVQFSGTNIFSHLEKPKATQDPYLRHETAFFREPKTFEVAIEYLNQHFPTYQQIDIWGSSTGEENCTFAMLQKESGTSAACKMTGYDIGSTAVESAKRGIFPINQLRVKQFPTLSPLPAELPPIPPNLSEEDQALMVDVLSALPEMMEFLNSGEAQKMASSMIKGGGDDYLVFEQSVPLTERQTDYQKLFQQYFEETEAPENFKSPYEASPMLETKTKFFKVKPELGETITFKEGDILELDQFIPKGQSQAIVFRNALYHLTSSEDFPGCKLPKAQEEIQPMLEKLVQKIHEALADNGLFVIGTHFMDHSFLHPNEQGEGLLHQILKQQGFEPIYWEDPTEQLLQLPGLDDEELAWWGKMPSIWRKLTAP